MNKYIVEITKQFLVSAKDEETACEIAEIEFEKEEDNSFGSFECTLKEDVLERHYRYWCEDCDEIVNWYIEDYKDRGEPVCPKCGGDMVATDHLKESKTI